MKPKPRRKRITRDEMALVYAGLIVSGDFPFSVLNERIIKYWSRKGLIYIKKKAWKMIPKLENWDEEFTQPK